MKLSDVVSHIEIDPRKLTEYALNPDNPVGADKAVIFQRVLGYNRDNYQSLLEQIQSQAMAAGAIPKSEDQHGQRYQVDLEVVGTESKRAIVRIGWIVQSETDFARLVTLYVKKRP
jgi:hypothetical protein